jgi:beta-glucanase (GH16 family)
MNIVLVKSLFLLSPFFWGCDRDNSETLPYIPNDTIVTSDEQPMLYGKWEKIEELSDEFDGSQLDADKWLNHHPYWTGRIPSQFNKENVSVSDGSLKIKTTLAEAAHEGSSTKHWIWTGCVTSKSEMCYYGYYEARLKACNLSMSNAFWLQSQKNIIEIDVTEAIGNSKLIPNDSKTMNINTHDTRNGGWENDIETRIQVELPDGKKSSDDFFIYGVLWEPTRIVFYLNNKKVGEINPKRFDKKMFLFFDVETFAWQGFPSVSDFQNEMLDKTMYVDYVRSYKRTDITYD